jgi:hypothetical protein
MKTIENKNAPNASQCKENGRAGVRSIVDVAAVVVIVTPTSVVVAVPVAATEVGENWQAAAVGSPEQAKLMVPLNEVE